MEELILTIATTLTVTPTDVYVFWVMLLFVIIMAALGGQKAYGMFIGLVVGLAIYLMLTVLLAPQYQTPDTTKLLSASFSTFLVSSSVYLLFILMVLTPLTGVIRVSESRQTALRVWMAVAVSAWVFVFACALVIGFALKTYIFNVETWFVLLSKAEWFKDLQSTVSFRWTLKHIQIITLFSVLYILYKILFADMVQTLLAALWNWLMSLRKNWAAIASHDDHGHDEMGFDEHDFMEADIHDDHGHDNHDHWHH